MTISGSFWSLSRFAQSWTQGTDPASLKPRPRRAVFTQQHIETIGGSDTPPQFDRVPATPTPLIGNPKLPVELIVHIVLLAAQDVVLDDDPAVSAKLLELARVSKLCHRAILATFVLPDLTLHGAQQIFALAVALEKDRLGIRTLAGTRIRSLTLRAQSSYAAAITPALFDASQAQMRFERQLLPWLRLVLPHCQALDTLRIEGVPRGLLARSGKSTFEQLAPRLTSFSCLVGHYAGDLERDFWLAQRWTNLARLQLHGPRLQFTWSLALSLAALPQLRRLGLVVPLVVSSPSTTITRTGADGDLDIVISSNPLQTLLDRSSTLEALLVVGHGERDYVGYSERLRNWMQDLRQERGKRKAQLKLVTVIRRTPSMQNGETNRARVHPCEVSAWMMQCAQQGLEWFEDEAQIKDSPTEAEFDHWVESWEPAEYATPIASNNVSNTTSRSMSRTGSNTGARNAVAQIDQIDATDMLSSDDDGSLD